MKKFSIHEAISVGWEKTRSNLSFLILVLFISFIINGLPGFTTNMIREDVPVLSSLITIAFWVLTVLVSMGTIKIALKLIDKKKPVLSDLYDEHAKLLRFILSTLVYSMIVTVGLIFFIVPGIILGIRFQFYSYLIIDRNMGPLQALKKSGEITSGNKWNLFLFALCMGLLNILGVLLLVVGLLVTIPITMIATAYVYRKLTPPSPVKKSS
jgi:uncharacterized membrane protein